MTEIEYIVKPIGIVRSELARREGVPHQGFEGHPPCLARYRRGVCQRTEGIKVGREIILITWFHQAERDILKVHPRGDRQVPLTVVL